MLEFRDVSKVFKSKVVLNKINLKINKGEMIVLIGPSGCGKTTTLKMINKLVIPTSGKIYIDGVDIAEQNTIELRRKMGYVIQQTGLFPHMTVEENIGLIPLLEKWPKEKVIERTMELLKMVGMNPNDYMDRYPGELSGGQQQRIGVARAFATNPDIILMDEPFSALDPITRNQLQDELYNLQQELKKTIIFVTHDMDEAIKLGDRICIMKDGVILQLDTPEQLLKNPSHGFVEEFIGKNRIWNQPEFIKAKDIMIERPVMVSGTRTVLHGIEIMLSNKVDSLLVVNKEHNLEGMVTLKNIRKDQDRNSKLVDIMDKNISSVQAEDSIVDVLKMMKDKDIGYVPVIDNCTKLVGLITRSSLISILSNQYINEEVEV